MSSSNYYNSETEQIRGNIIDRLFSPCPRFNFFSLATPDDVIFTCFKGELDWLECCCCEYLEDEEGNKKVNHHTLILRFDGAVSNNGQQGATGGIGVFSGEEVMSSERLDDQFGGMAITSQRAELIAAIWALHKAKVWQDMRESGKPGPEIVIAGDSEYVVKVISEWYPKWKRNGWKNSSGTRAGNLDLFHKL
ncbi:ribonuclease H-like protein [Meredithblackwellia eburnea MCA 4105]